MHLLTRNLLACSDSFMTEFMITHEAFCALLTPDSPKAASYRETRPAPANMLDRIIRAGDGSFDTIISKFAWFLSWLEVEYCESCVLVLGRLREFLKTHKLPLHQECHSKLLESEELWRGVFRVWRLGTSKLDVYDMRGKDVGDDLCCQVLFYVFSAIIASVESSQGVEESLPVARVIPVLQADFLGTLDEILPKIVSRREQPGLQVVNTIFGMHTERPLFSLSSNQLSWFASDHYVCPFMNRTRGIRSGPHTCHSSMPSRPRTGLASLPPSTSYVPCPSRYSLRSKRAPHIT